MSSRRKAQEKCKTSSFPLRSEEKAESCPLSNKISAEHAIAAASTSPAPASQISASPLLAAIKLRRIGSAEAAMLSSQITVTPAQLAGAQAEAAAGAVLSMSKLTTRQAKGTPALTVDCLPLML